MLSWFTSLMSIRIPRPYVAGSPDIALEDAVARDRRASEKKSSRKGSNSDKAMVASRYDCKNMSRENLLILKLRLLAFLSGVVTLMSAFEGHVERSGIFTRDLVRSGT